MIKLWRQFFTDLTQPASGPDGFRGRYYILGAGQAVQVPYAITWPHEQQSRYHELDHVGRYLLCWNT